MSDIRNRSEILFFYDIENANPNGDPNDENKPRIDEESGKNIVTDVRLKRTIRDYLHAKGDDIFVREKVYDDDGHIQDAKLRAADYLQDDEKTLAKLSAEEQRKKIAAAILNECIDVRLFGATIPLELKVGEGKKAKMVKSSITFTGPVQFKMGKSMHSVKLKHIKGTGAFASGRDATRKTFREEYILPYSLITFYGIINENAGKHTLLQVEDIEKFIRAAWNGTKGLISRSKFGQMPRLLLKVNYNRPDFFIGDMDNLVKLKSEKRDEAIRKPEDCAIDLTSLIAKMVSYSDRIESVEFIADNRLRCIQDGEIVALDTLDKFKDISAEVQ